MKPVRLLIFSLLFSALLSLPVQAQERCATVPYMQNLQEKYKTSESTKQFEEWLQNKISDGKRLNNLRQQSGPYKVPVVVHVIHNGEAVGTLGNISAARILSQIAVLNEDFKRLNADASETPVDFLPVAGSMDIEFVLAESSPEGLPTNGIVRVNGGKFSWSINQDEQLKAVSYWPSEDYLNIWVTNLGGGYLGYAQFPVSGLPGLEDYVDGAAETDGVVIDYTVFGVGSEDAAYNLGRTTTHEIGHFFGLRHIWGDTNDCTGTDYVTDTPNQADETYDCPTHPVTDCTVPKMFQNYMDYTDDDCMNLFTQLQVSRMISVLENSPRRESLLHSPGLAGPSGLGEDLKIAEISSPTPVSCDESPSLNFRIINLGSPTIESFEVNCTVNEAEIIYAAYTGVFIESGDEFDISIPITLGKGGNSINIEVHSPNNFADANPVNNDSLISVVVNDTRDAIPLREQFDEITFWTTVNPSEGMEWKSTSTNFNKSIYFNAFDNVQADDQSWIVSPILDFSQTEKASMFFDYSYSWNNTGNDQLSVRVSTDCGATYVPIFNASGAQLATASVISEWSPTTSEHWQQNFLDLSSFAGEENVRVAFVVTNAHGNNLFVDNIEFFVSDDPSPVDPGNNPYAIYWNTSGGVDITFNLEERGSVAISVVDMMGREVTEMHAHDILNQTFPLATDGLETGLYIIRLQINKKYYSTKVYLSP